MDVFYNLRRLLIAEKIHALKSELQATQEVQEAIQDNRDALSLSEIIQHLKQLLFEKLNRVI